MITGGKRSSSTTPPRGKKTKPTQPLSRRRVQILDKIKTLDELNGYLTGTAKQINRNRSDLKRAAENDPDRASEAVREYFQNYKTCKEKANEKHMGINTQAKLDEYFKMGQTPKEKDNNRTILIKWINRNLDKAPEVLKDFSKERPKQRRQVLEKYTQLDTLEKLKAFLHEEPDRKKRKNKHDNLKKWISNNRDKAPQTLIDFLSQYKKTEAKETKARQTFDALESNTGSGSSTPQTTPVIEQMSAPDDDNAQEHDLDNFDFDAAFKDIPDFMPDIPENSTL